MTKQRGARLYALIGLSGRAVRFGLVGVASIGVYFLVLWSLEDVLLPISIKAAISYAASAVFNYLLQSTFTFGANPKSAGRLTRYLGLHGLTLTLNSAAMSLLVNGFELPVYPSQLATTTVVAGTSFLLSNFWVFRSANSGAAPGPSEESWP